MISQPPRVATAIMPIINANICIAGLVDLSVDAREPRELPPHFVARHEAKSYQAREFKARL